CAWSSSIRGRLTRSMRPLPNLAMLAKSAGCKTSRPIRVRGLISRCTTAANSTACRSCACRGRSPPRRRSVRTPATSKSTINSWTRPSAGKDDFTEHVAVDDRLQAVAGLLHGDFAVNDRSHSGNVHELSQPAQLVTRPHGRTVHAHLQEEHARQFGRRG